MSELRRDPITGRWVVIAPEQNDAALYEQEPAALPPVDHCPFCEGHENATGHELLASRNGSGPNGPGWDLRVVPNREPALRIEGDFDRASDGPYERMRSIGAHEVVIDTPRHGDSLGTMSEAAVTRVLWACRERIRDLKRDIRFRLVVVFKNHGTMAGARQAHAHTQIVALPFVPSVVDAEVRGARHYMGETGQCAFCAVVRHEAETRTRVVASNDHAIAIAPYASRFPFEVWVLPRVHQARFEQATDEVLAGAAAVLRQVATAFDAALVQPAFNMVLHTAPFLDAVDASYHWHLELVPRVVRAPGLEWGSGTAVNPVAPEEAALVLRKLTNLC